MPHRYVHHRNCFDLWDFVLGMWDLIVGPVAGPLRVLVLYLIATINVFRVDVSLFNVAFSFDYRLYDAPCGRQSWTGYLRYALIGGAIVGAVALVMAVAWFVVKKVIKKKTSPSFRVLGQDIDLLTDGDETDNELYDVVEP